MEARRLCSCPDNHLNCLTAKEWTKAMIGVWEFDYSPLDIRDKKLHPATFPIALAKKVIKLFTHKGNVVVDPFCGSGTTLVACQDLTRHGIGLDLNPEYCVLARGRLANRKIGEFPSGRVKGSIDQFVEKGDVAEIEPESVEETPPVNLEVICDDALNVADYIPANSIDLVLTSPPYANILNKSRTNKSKHSAKRHDGRLGVNEQYSSDTRDLGTKEPADFIDLMKQLSAKIYTVLKPGTHYVINIRDVVPFFIQPPLISTLTELDFALKNIIIWDKRKLIQGMGIFGWPSNYIALNSAYEYIFDFMKPKEVASEE
ncbi:MAG TPA: DNA methyltransferase [Candidatus Lokiarchaeia archaeon]|nr:DNA methyltransferase [Candidatus Lokiarchaeia archaeon]